MVGTKNVCTRADRRRECFGREISGATRADGVVVVVAVVVAVAAAAAAWCDSLLLLCSVIVSHQHEGFEVPQHPDGPEPNDE